MALAAILYVEDEATDVLLMRHAARKIQFPHPLQVVENGELAMKYLAGEGKFADRAQYPLPAVVLLDLNLPIVSGLEVLEWIRRHPRFERLPVIVFSGSGLDRDVQKARELGSNGYEIKPGIDQLPSLLLRIQEQWLIPAARTGQCPPPE